MKISIKKPFRTTASRLIFSLAGLVALGCTSAKAPASVDTRPYEILTRQSDGGGNIRFYEILTTEKDVSMLSDDERLSRRVLPSEARTSTFLVLNMGEKPTGGYALDVESVKEIPERIIVTLKEVEPEPGSMNIQQVTYPYTVVRVNSKKPIEIR